MKYILSLLFFCIFLGNQTVIGQNDTLYVQHLDTVKLNIDQPYIPVICCAVDDSISVISVYFLLTTNSTNPVILNKVYAGGGSVIFGYRRYDLFQNGELFGELKHMLYGDYKKQGVRFIFYDKELDEFERWFIWIGKRKD